MAAIILPHRWRVPPQVPCEVNENHWLVANGGFVFAPTTNRSLIAPDPWRTPLELPQTNAANAEPRFDPVRGIRLYSDNGGNNDDRLQTTLGTYPNAQGRALTSVVVFTPLAQSSTGTIWRGAYATYNSGHSCYLTDSGKTIGGGFIGGNGFHYYGTISGKTYTEGKQSVFAISTRVGEMAVNFDGGTTLTGTSGDISYVGAGSGPSISDPCQPRIYEGDFTNHYHFNGWIGLWIHAPNVYADVGGLASIVENPWQVLRPLRRRLYIPSAAAGVTFEQEGFRWRYDDGDEDGATFSAAQDEPSAASIGITKRLRVLVDVTGNPGSPAAEQFQLQYRRTGSPTEEWKKVN